MLECGNSLRQGSAQEFLSLDIKFLLFEYCEIFKKSFFYRTPLLAASGYYFTTAKLITKLVIFYDWKFSVIQLIFCYEINLVSRASFISDIGWRWRCFVCTLNSSDIREAKFPGDCHQAYEVYTKRTLHKVWCFPLY